jgi:hypothetical protein
MHTLTSDGTKQDDQLPDLLAFETKMMHELPLHLCRQRIERVKPVYIQRHGLDAARRIHAAMVAKLIARKAR